MPSATSDRRQEPSRGLSAPVVVGLFVSLFGATLLGWLDLSRWLYWRRTLETAMVAHASFHLPLLVLALVQVAMR